MNYFEFDEFKCKCGCGMNRPSKELLDKTDKARGLAGIPFIINSACRCPKRNINEGGSETSSHITTDVKECEAVDIRCNNSTERFAIVFGMLSAGFNRIGVAGDFVHGDVDKSKAKQVMWVY